MSAGTDGWNNCDQLTTSCPGEDDPPLQLPVTRSMNPVPDQYSSQTRSDSVRTSLTIGIILVMPGAAYTIATCNGEKMNWTHFAGWCSSSRQPRHAQWRSCPSANNGEACSVRHRVRDDHRDVQLQILSNSQPRRMLARLVPGPNERRLESGRKENRRTMNPTDSGVSYPTVPTFTKNGPPSLHGNSRKMPKRPRLSSREVIVTPTAALPCATVVGTTCHWKLLVIIPVHRSSVCTVPSSSPSATSATAPASYTSTSPTRPRFARPGFTMSQLAAA